MISTRVCVCFCRATLKEEGTDSEFCTDVSVGNTTNFTLSLTLESCESFGSTPLYVLGEGGGEREGGREVRENG